MTVGDYTIKRSVITFLAIVSLMIVLVIPLIRAFGVPDIKGTKASIGKDKYIQYDMDGDGGSDLLVYGGENDSQSPTWRAMITPAVRSASFDPATASKQGEFISWHTQEPLGIPVPGDYNGDGVIDLGVFQSGFATDWNSSSHNWRIFLAQSPSVSSRRFEGGRSKDLRVSWGFGDARAVSADYDGDGATDIAVFEPNTAMWSLLYARGGFNETKALLQHEGFGAVVQWGLPGDIPVVGDYDGDGRSDLVVWRVGGNGVGKEEGQWFLKFLSKNQRADDKSLVVKFGRAGDIPVPADYTCDGKTDIAVFRPSTGQWLIRVEKGSSSVRSERWQVEGGEPIATDFDGDGCADFAFFSPSGRVKWTIWYSGFSQSANRILGRRKPIIKEITWGNSGELPVELWLRKHRTGGVLRATR